MNKNDMKCAIITHYYESYNYGGTLQAYALCEFLKKNEITAEQISFDYMWPTQSFFEKIRAIFNNGFIYGWNILKNKLIRYYKRVFCKDELRAKLRRNISFNEFRDKRIPHTEEIYNKDNIYKCVAQFDAFITGSDQVWNTSWYSSAYFLDFVPSNKIKLSYAASSAKDSLSEEQQELFRNSLKDYQAVSVREENMVDLLEGISPVTPEWVVDPVLLLDRIDWDKVASHRKVGAPYIFCYFLGDNKTSRTLAQKFAKRIGYKLVSIPMTTDRFSRKFANILVEDASPEDFISLIKNAEYIFTDSFHASVFSVIYKKNFFVFNRSSLREMSSRIVSLLDMFGIRERFCDTEQKESLDYIEKMQNIDYSQESESFILAKKHSKDFLLENLTTKGKAND